MTLCNRPAQIAMLELVDNLVLAGHLVQPICQRCVGELAALYAGTPLPPPEIDLDTLRQVLAERLGADGADEVLAEIRASGEAFK